MATLPVITMLFPGPVRLQLIQSLDLSVNRKKREVNILLIIELTGISCKEKPASILKDKTASLGKKELFATVLSVWSIILKLGLNVRHFHLCGFYF